MCSVLSAAWNVQNVENAPSAACYQLTVQEHAVLAHLLHFTSPHRVDLRPQLENVIWQGKGPYAHYP